MQASEAEAKGRRGRNEGGKEEEDFVPHVLSLFLASQPSSLNQHY